MRRADEDETMETAEGNVEEEQPGELPKMREMKARKARLHRKIQSHQMKELQEERLKMGQTMEGYLEQFQENQQQMVELERQVEQLKEREQQKASEIRNWKSSSDALQKDSLRLKRQLAVVTERLAKAEKSAAEADARASVEQLHMRLADYESLVVEFADQASRVVEGVEDLEPTDLSPHFEESDSLDKLCPPPSFGLAGEIAIDSAAVPPPVVAATAGFPLALRTELEAEVEMLKAKCAEVQAEMHALSTRCSETEDSRLTAVSQCAQLQVTADTSSANCAAAEAVAADADAMCVVARSELQVAQERSNAAEEAAKTMTAKCDHLEASHAIRLAEVASQRDEALQGASQREARAHSELQERVARCMQEEAQAEAVAQDCARLKDELHEIRKAIDVGAQKDGDAQQSGVFLSELQDYVARHEQAEMQAQAAEKDCAQAKADLQALQRTVDKTAHMENNEILQSAPATTSQSQLAVTAAAAVAAAAAAEKKQRLRAFRSTHALDALFSRVHRDRQQHAHQRHHTKREGRRHQSELVVARALHIGWQQQRQPEAAPVSGRDCQARALDENEDDAPRECDDMARKLAGAEVQAREAQHQASALQARLDKMMAAAQDEVAGLQEELRAQRAAIHQHGQSDGSTDKLAEQRDRDSVVEAQCEELKRLRQTVKDLQQWRADAEAANAQVAMLRREAAEARAALMEQEEDSGWSTMMQEEKSAYEGRINSLQQHLDEEVEQLDTLAAAHEDVLAISEKLNLEKVELEKRLLMSQKEGKVAEQTLKEAVSYANEKLAALQQERSRDKLQLRESFEEQLQACASKAHQALEALREEQAACMDSEKRRLALVARLDEERIEAASRDAAAGSQLSCLTERQAALEKQSAEVQAQLEEARRLLDDAREERSLLEHNLSDASAALDQGSLERRALQERIREHEEAAVVCETLGKQLSEANARLQTSATEREQLEECLQDVAQRLSNEEAARAVVEQQLRSSVGAEEAAAAARSSLDRRIAELVASQEEALLRLRSEEAAHAESQQRLVGTLAVEVAAAQARDAADARHAELVLSESALVQDEISKAAAKAAATAAEAASAERNDIQLKLVHAQEERDAAKSQHLLAQDDVFTLSSELSAQQDKLQNVCAELRVATEKHAEAVQRLQELGEHSGHWARERVEMNELLDQQRQASGHDREQLAAIQSQFEEVSLFNADVKQQLAQARSEIAAFSSDCQALRAQLRESEEGRAQAARCLEEAEGKVTAFGQERDAQAGKQVATDAQLAEAIELHRASAASRDTLQDELAVAMQSAAFFQAERSELLCEFRGEISKRQAANQEESQVIIALQQESKALRAEQAQAMIDAENKWAVAAMELAEQKEHSIRDQEKSVSDQARRHADDLARTVQAREEELKQLMQGEAQKYMQAVQDQARTAIAQRDVQITQLSERMQAAELRSKELMSKLASEEEKSGTLQSQVVGDATRQELSDATSKLYVVNCERDNLNGQLADAKQQIQATAAQRDELQQRVAELLCSQQDDDLAQRLTESSAQAEALRQELERERESAEARISQLTAAEAAALAEAAASASAAADAVEAAASAAAAEAEATSASAATARREEGDREQQQLAAEHVALLERLASTSAQLDEVSAQRNALRTDADNTRQELETMATRCTTLQNHMGDVSPQLDEMRSLLAHEGVKTDRIRQQLDQANAERESLMRQLEELQSQSPNSEKLGVDELMQSQFSRERGALENKVAALSSQLSDMTADGRELQHELDESRRHLGSTRTQTEALRAQSEERGAQLGEAQRRLAEEQLASGRRLEDLAAEASVERGGLEEQLAAASRYCEELHAEREELRLLSAGRERERDEALLALRREAEEAASRQKEEEAAGSAGPAPAAAPPPPPPAFDVEQATAEREALEAAFRAQMEQVQRDLSAKTIEAETLRHQLSAMGGAAAGTKAALTFLEESGSNPASTSLDGGAVGATSAAWQQQHQQQELQWQQQEHLNTQCKQLQLRVSAVEEEKAVMLREMREHILQLARENYDLKQQQQQQFPQPPQPSQPALATIRDNGAEGSGDTDTAQAPTQAGMADDVDRKAHQREAAETGSVGAHHTSSGGGWLSYVLSPFLTDSDLREIHAESYVGEALKSQPLVSQ